MDAVRKLQDDFADLRKAITEREATIAAAIEMLDKSILDHKTIQQAIKLLKGK